MHKVWAVIRREFVERVRTRVFILSTLLFPLFMALLVVLPAYLMSRSVGTKSIVLVDGTSDDLGRTLETALVTARIGKDAAAKPRYSVLRIPALGRTAEVRDSLVPFTGRSRKTANGFDGILVVSDSTVPTGKAAYYGANVASFDDMRELEQTLRPVEVLEVVLPEVAHLDAVELLCLAERGRRLRHEDLAAVRGRADARRQVEAEAEVALLLHSRLAGVEPHPNAQLGAVRPLVRR